MSDKPSVNPDHIIIVLQKQRELLWNSLTQAEIDKVALAERVAILEAERAAAPPAWDFTKGPAPLPDEPAAVT